MGFLDDLADSHCHLSADVDGKRVRQTIELWGNYGLRERFFHVMSTNQYDAYLVSQLAQTVGDDILPYFGVHPWYSHLFTTKKRDIANLKHQHYNEILNPPPPSELLEVLPEPVYLDDHLEQVKNILQLFRFAGVGEIGLDKLFRVPMGGYLGNKVEGDGPLKLSSCRVKMDHQVEVLKAHLQLATNLGKQVSLHCVKAHGVLFDTVKQYDIPNIILHSYSGSVDQAKVWVRFYQKKDNLLFSFSNWINGVEKNQTAFESILGVLSDSQILIESDLPVDVFLIEEDTVQGYKNHLEQIFTKICKAKGWNYNQGREIIRSNINRSIGLI